MQLFIITMNVLLFTFFSAAHAMEYLSVIHRTKGLPDNSSSAYCKVEAC